MAKPKKATKKPRTTSQTDATTFLLTVIFAVLALAFLVMAFCKY